LSTASYEKASSKEDLDPYEQLIENLNKFNRPKSQDEYENYIAENPLRIKISPLEWWCEDEQRERWPRLSLMAIDILSIPAMSDEPERIFSGARRTVSWERAKLGVDTIEMLECSKNWRQNRMAIEEF
jgi:hypothetical protein